MSDNKRPDIEGIRANELGNYSELEENLAAYAKRLEEGNVEYREEQHKAQKALCDRIITVCKERDAVKKRIAAL